MNRQTQNNRETIKDELPYFFELKYPYHFDSRIYQAYFVWQKVGEKYKILKSRTKLPKKDISEAALLKLKNENAKLVVSNLQKELEAKRKLMALDVRLLEEELERTKIENKNKLAALEARLTKIRFLVDTPRIFDKVAP